MELPVDMLQTIEKNNRQEAEKDVGCNRWVSPESSYPSPQERHNTDKYQEKARAGISLVGQINKIFIVPFDDIPLFELVECECNGEKPNEGKEVNLI